MTKSEVTSLPRCDVPQSALRGEEVGGVGPRLLPGGAPGMEGGR